MVFFSPNKIHPVKKRSARLHHQGSCSAGKRSQDERVVVFRRRFELKKRCEKGEGYRKGRPLSKRRAIREGRGRWKKRGESVD